MKAKTKLQNLKPRPKPARLTAVEKEKAMQLVNVAANMYGIPSPDLLFAPGRKHRYRRAAAVACWSIRTGYGFAAAQLAPLFQRSRSQVYHLTKVGCDTLRLYEHDRRRAMMFFGRLAFSEATDRIKMKLKRYEREARTSAGE